LYDLKVLAEWSVVGSWFHRSPRPLLPEVVTRSAVSSSWHGTGSLGEGPMGTTRLCTVSVAATDDQDLLYYKSQKVGHDEDIRRIKEYFLRNNNEKFVTQKFA
jgi:hypothetical protein